MKKNLKVAIVGAGPGEMDLLTVRAVKLLREADCVVYDRLLNKRILDILKDSCERIYVGKENHHHTLPQDEINRLLLSKAKEHELVVRLKGGDPYVFGRGSEEALFLSKNGIEVEVVSGISSAIAALSSAGIPITHRGKSMGFKVMTAHSRKDSLSDINYKECLDENITYVFLMGLSHVEEIAGELIKAGRRPDTPAAVVHNGTKNSQKKCVGTLSDIASKVRQEGISSPAIIVVGKCVELQGGLSFFENRPLFGKRFLLPKLKSFSYGLSYGDDYEAFEGFEGRLERLGAEVISVPTGRIAPVSIDLSFLRNLSSDDCIAFTSANGVRAFFYNLFEIGHKDVRSIPDCMFAVVGKKTKEVLRGFGISADIISGKQTAEDLFEILSKNNDKGKIYWLCGRERSYEAKDEGMLSRLDPVTCYETVPFDDTASGNDSDTLQDYHGVIFTSAYNARFAFGRLNISPLEVFSIGPSCTKEIRRFYTGEVTQAKMPSYDGLIDALLED